MEDALEAGRTEPDYGARSPVLTYGILHRDTTEHHYDAVGPHSVIGIGSFRSPRPTTKGTVCDLDNHLHFHITTILLPQ
jgi:hypothetical protein